jgi:hypothetical protein
MNNSLSAAQFGGDAGAMSGSDALSGPLGSSGMPGGIGNSSSGLSGAFAGGMGSGGGGI